MMLATDIPGWIIAVGGVVAIVSALAGVIGYFRAGVSKATIDLYKEDNDALRARLKTLEEQVASDASKIQALQASRDYLTSVVTQAEALKEMKIAVDKIALHLGVSLA